MLGCENRPGSMTNKTDASNHLATYLLILSITLSDLPGSLLDS